MIIEKEVYRLNLTGTHYEVGHALGEIAGSFPPLREFMTKGFPHLNREDYLMAHEMFDKFCPGLNEELEGYADALGAKPEEITYVAMTYLIPRCSQLALLPSKTDDGHTRLARNYEFSHDTEDFTLQRRAVTGKHTVLGTTEMVLGFTEGLNDQGLIVSMSSCGFPVSAMPMMRNPELRGLMFWAIIKTLLERCATVEECLKLLSDMPIAYNINLMLCDRGGHACLFETVSGTKAHREIDSGTKDQYLHATNHVHLTPLKDREPKLMNHSVTRYRKIEEFIDDRDKVSVSDLKTLLGCKYPEGLTAHYYEDYFGTTKSVIIDGTDGTYSICWGGNPSNGWQTYDIREPLPQFPEKIKLSLKRAQKDFFQFIERTERD